MTWLGLAAVVAYVFRHANVSTVGSDLQTGAIFGLLCGVAMAFNLYAVTNWSNVTVAFVEPVVTAVRMALGGAVIGWTLGLGSGT